MDWLLALMMQKCTWDGPLENFERRNDWIHMVVNKDDVYEKSGGRTRAQLSCMNVCDLNEVCTAEFKFKRVGWNPVDKPITIFDYHSKDDACDDKGRAGPMTLQLQGDYLVAKVHSDVEKEGACSKYPHHNTIRAQYRHKVHPVWGTSVKLEYLGRWDDRGSVRLWVNGKEVWQYEGITAYQDASLGNVKLGPYQFKWEGWPVDTVKMRFTGIRFESREPGL